MIKAVFFDAGGTLLTPFPSVGGVYAQVARRHGVIANDGEIDSRFKAAWKIHRASRQTVDKAWWHSVVSTVFKDHHFDNFDLFFEDVYLAFEKKESWKVFDDVFPTLQQLKERSLQTALLSNWDSRLPALLDKLGLSSYFDRQFISFGMNLMKPNPLFFKHALEQMDLHPMEVIHIGDDLEEDVKAAEAAGIRAYLIDRQTRPLNSRMLKSLDEIFVRI